VTVYYSVWAILSIAVIFGGACAAATIGDLPLVEPPQPRWYQMVGFFYALAGVIGGWASLIHCVLSEIYKH
jgi:hypothetical protein